jgi:hypothetical protein
MITGQKPSGYFVTSDGEGRKIEGETRQCIHCQFVWEYGPNTPKEHLKTRGYCFKHHGFICCRTECLQLYGLAPTCDSFEEQQKRLADQLQKKMPLPELGLDGNYDVTQSGIIIKH